MDVIVAGPPCQGFSLTGPRNFDDPRNKLYLSVFKAVKRFKPEAFVIENVPGLATLYGGKIRNEIARRFRLLGYEVVSDVLCAADYGVPQLRNRIFFVGLKKKYGNYRFPSHILSKNSYVTCAEAISDLPSRENELGNDVDNYSCEPETEYQTVMRDKCNTLYNHVATNHTDMVKEVIAMVPEGGNHKDLPTGVGESRRFNEAWTRYHGNRPSKTIDTGHRNHFHYIKGDQAVLMQCFLIRVCKLKIDNRYSNMFIFHFYLQRIDYMNANDYYHKNEVKIYYIFGTIYILYGITISVLFYYNVFNWGSIVGSIFISVGIAIIAGGISIKSTIMTGAIMESHFSEAIGNFEDRRLAMRESLAIIQKKKMHIENYNESKEFQVDKTEFIIYYSFSIWKCRTYLDRARIFEDNFTVRHENRLIHHVDCLFQDLCVGKKIFGIPLIDESFKHLDYIQNKISIFKKYNEDNIKEEVRRMRISNNLNFLNNQSRGICYWDKCEIVS